MQKVTYTNVLGDGVVFWHAPYVLANVEGTGPTDLAAATLRGAYQDGVTVASVRRDKREVRVRFSIEGVTRAGLYERRAALCAALSAGRAFANGETARLIYENDAGRWWTHALPEVGPEFKDRLSTWEREARVSFLCQSAYWYAPEMSSVTLAYSGDGFELPFDFPIAFGSQMFSRVAVNGGPVPTPCVIEIAGSGETPELVNERTGARIQLTSALPSGARLQINTDPARLSAVVTDAEGAVTSAFPYLDISAPISAFTLMPGDNRLTYVPGGTAALSRIVVRWYERWEGV